MPSLRQKPDGRFFIDYREDGQRRRIDVVIDGVSIRDPTVAAAFYTAWEGQQQSTHRAPRERATSPRIDDLLNYYRDTYHVANNAAEATQAAAQTHCSVFLEWCRSERIGRAQQLNTEVLTRFGAYLQTGPHKKSPRTTANYLATIRAALHVAVEAGKLEAMPIRKWVLPKFDAIEKHPLTLAELRAVMLAFADIPVVLWMCLTGQRPSDARTLKFGDVDIPTGTVHRPSVKVRALRKFEICAEAARLVEAEATRPHSPADVVFRTSHGTPWSADGLLNTIKARCRKRTEIRHFTPKMLRDAFGTIMANDIGLPLPELQILMGHTDIKTTMQYVRARGARTWLDTYDREVVGTTPLNGAQSGAQNTGTTS